MVPKPKSKSSVPHDIFCRDKRGMGVLYFQMDWLCWSHQCYRQGQGHPAPRVMWWPITQGNNSQCQMYSDSPWHRRWHLDLWHQTYCCSRGKIMVARITLHDMRKNHGKPIWAFAARLRGGLTCGLAYQDIQLDLMTDGNQNMTLEEIFQFVDAKESGRCSALWLFHDQTQGAQTLVAPTRSTRKMT